LPDNPNRRQASCPRPEVWREIAVGSTDPDLTLTCIEHASRCDTCGPLLRHAVAELGQLRPELTDAERREISLLESAKPAWQMKLAQRIAGNIVPSPAPVSDWRRWLRQPGLAALATVMVAASVGWWVFTTRGSADSANRYLAQAYTDQRTLELRIPDAAYAPLRVQKGPAASFIGRPPALLKAEALIADRLSRNPDDPAWLQASGRADVLEGKYDAAVESLRRAVELKPHAPDLLLDLGAAYFQRAQLEDRHEDFVAAFEYLSQVLVQQPDNATALFNRAIVAEHQSLYRQALEDWEHYLKVDPQSQWSEEARSHAEVVRAKLKEHQNGAKPLLPPTQIGDPTREDVERRVERYLDAAIQSWLPQAYPEHGKPGDPQAQQALFFLAELLAQNHQDNWLSDLLKGSSSPAFPSAVAALAQASQSNYSSDFTVSHARAVEAARLFRASNNRAGFLRAQFEQTYAEQLTRNTTSCRGLASSALAAADREHYPWLQVQLRLEKAVCTLLGKDDWGANEHLSREAAERAQASGYERLYVRALFFVADGQLNNGDLSDGMRSSFLGLKRYWDGDMPAYLAYNFYAGTVDMVSEFSSTRPHFVMASWLEAAAIVDSTDDLFLRAWAHSGTTRAAAALQQPQVAQQQAAEAARLLALAPQTDANRDFVLWNEIHTARVETRLGQFESGISRLTAIQSRIASQSDKFLEEGFYATLGELELRSHNPALAEEAFRPAIESAERRLRSLISEAERISWSVEAAPLYLGMAEAELVQGHNERSLEYFEWYLTAASRRRREGAGPNPPATPDEGTLTARIPLLTHQTVLAYAALPDGLAIWCYDNRGVRAQLVPGANPNLQDLATRFYELAADPKSSGIALRRHAQNLYNALVAPLEPQLESDRTLIIEADGWLDRIPFEALVDRRGHYLIERAPIVHSHGQNSDSELESDRTVSAEAHALIVGSTAASEDAGLIPLPDVSAEADSVARNFHSSLVLRASEATLAAVERDLPAATVFHFTGHSLANRNGAALLLASPGSNQAPPALLTADALRRLDLHNLRLAVLSTCNTESGRDGSRGFNSIAAALQRAGVPHIVGSRWAVDAVETRKFVDSFYRNALSGQSVPGAVRQTAQAMIADPRTSHPYYWSAFSAYGRP
jgi:CHAT domain-containing protein/tetratricopeptide (TPR) repeat protein